MIILYNLKAYGFEAAIRGMRNPMNSWDKMDSAFDGNKCIIGPNDYNLMTKLISSGTEHRKFLRMIYVSMDVTAPLYWWKEFDTYKVGVTSNSCSTMHKIASRHLDIKDFSADQLNNENFELFKNLLNQLNKYIDRYNTCSDENNRKKLWYQIIQMLPSSYMQKRTISMNYENVFTIIHQRKEHKLNEWREFVFSLMQLPHVKELLGGSVLDDYIYTKDICKMYSVNEKTVYRWIRRGLLKSYKDSCGRYIFYKHDLNSFRYDPRNRRMK